MEIALIGEDAGLVHRGAVALSRLLESALDKVVGPPGGPVPDHAMLALGALSSLASSCNVQPARQAAMDAIDELGRARPEVRLPPPELVAEAVAKMKADHDARMAAAQEEELEAEAAAAKAKADEEALKVERKAKAEARKAKLDSVPEGNGAIVEEVDEDDEDDDALEVI